MELKMTNEEVFRLAGIDIDEICKIFREKILLEELYAVKADNMAAVKELIAECMDLEVEVSKDEENPRACFHCFDGKLLVLKRRQFDLKLLFQEAGNLPEAILGSSLERIWVLVRAFAELFVDILDGDCATIFAILCEIYFKKGIKLNNIEIYGQINNFLNMKMAIEWPYKKINDSLIMLENAGVIEWENGMLQMKDKISF